MNEWRAVVGYDGLYEVSDDGRVRSVRRAGTAGDEIALSLSPKGYPTVRLYRGNVRSARAVHRLVLESFMGPRPEGCEARHLNDIKADNRLENLAWGTSAENSQDAIDNERNANRRKVQCPQGHPYDEKNTRTSKRGWRICHECQMDSQRRRRARRKVMA